MTRDELREKVARAICYTLPGTGNIDDHFTNEHTRELWVNLADAAIDTIFAALKEPTHDMCMAYYNTTLNDSASTDWQAMLSASSLAPSKEKK